MGDEAGSAWIHRRGKWGFGRGWRRAVRKLGENVSFLFSEVTAEHHVCVHAWGTGVGLLSLTRPPPSLPSAAWLQLRALGSEHWPGRPTERFRRQNWHFPIVFQNCVSLEHARELANFVSIKLFFLSSSNWKSFPSFSFPFSSSGSDFSSLWTYLQRFINRHSLFFKLLEAGAISGSEYWGTYFLFFLFLGTEIFPLLNLLTNYKGTDCKLHVGKNKYYWWILI